MAKKIAVGKQFNYFLPGFVFIQSVLRNNVHEHYLINVNGGPMVQSLCIFV